ncbi:MAG: response regulator transcription factor [Verrucomicrobia bacterium]|nr:response regulator transcription factor [Verrucomicrobiota bacterium]
MKAPHNESKSIVVVIDDDQFVREALDSLLRSVGLRVELFASVQEYLNSARQDAPGCIVLDVRLPGRSGLDFQNDLVKADQRMPVIFISGHADVPMSVRAMKAGAFEFLTKPVRQQDLLDAVQNAIEHDRARRGEEHALARLRTDFESLTPRERQVMERVVAGLLNKQIALEVGIAEATVKHHRAQLMRKMRVESLAELVTIAERLGLLRTRS